MKNAGATEGYHRYFTEQLRLVFSLTNHLYRKMLAVSILDTFARARHPDVKGNRERFVQTIESLADWPDGHRVSLPQLRFYLSGQDNIRGGCLADETARRVEQWSAYQVHRITKDPLPEELVPFAATPEEEKALKECRHFELLYVYRNHLVHEFREPGYDMGNLDDDPTPYYMSMENEQGEGVWELAYPTNFFAYITERSLSNLKTYLEANDLDPYSCYEFGSIWKRGRRRK